MIKNFIIKSNTWYDNLPEPKRSLFFFIVILGSLIFTQYLFYVKNMYWTFPTWALIVSIWRTLPIFLKK